MSIPGYFFDEVKKKYFKIQPNHVAPPGSAYSVDGIKRTEKEEQEVQTYRRAQEFKRATRIRRAAVLDFGVPGGFALGLESGKILNAPRLSASIWAWNLDRSRCLPFGHIYGAVIRVTAALRDEETGTIIVGSTMAAEDRTSVQTWAPRKRGDPDFDLSRHKYCSSDAQIFIDWHISSQITSLCITASRVLVMTALGTGGGTDRVVMTKLKSSESFSSGQTGDSLAEGESIEMQPASGGGTGIFDASANGDASDTVVAVATGAGVLCIWPPAHSTNTWTEQLHRTSSEVMATTWLSNTVFAGGCRNGHVWLYDRRSGGKIQRLRHSSAVTSLTVADEHRLVIAGMEHQLSTYDLRATPPLAQSSFQASPPSRPYITYPSYRNSASLFLPFDVSPTLSLIATAYTKSDAPSFRAQSAPDKRPLQRRIIFMDLWSGKEVSSSIHDDHNAVTREPNAAIRALKFSGDGSGDSSLLLGSANAVEEWSW